MAKRRNRRKRQKSSAKSKAPQQKPQSEQEQPASTPEPTPAPTPAPAVRSGYGPPSPAREAAVGSQAAAESSWASERQHGEDVQARGSEERFARFTRLDALITTAVSLVTCWIYTLTLVPTVYAEDSGEFITGALDLGVVHPPGYPLYTMLSHMFRYLPFGSPAWRINFSSAVFGGLCIGLFYLLCRRLIRDRWAAAGAALVFGFSRVFWSQALHAEVYTLNMLFICAMFLALIKWRIDSNDRWFYLGVFIVALALTNHTTSVLFPIVFAFYLFLVFCLKIETLQAFGACLAVSFVVFLSIGTIEPGGLLFRTLQSLETEQNQIVSDPLLMKRLPQSFAVAVFIFSFGGFLLYRFGKKLKTRIPFALLIVVSTMAIYLYVPTRALTSPDINFGNPDSLESLVYTIERRQYLGDQQPENYWQNKLNFLKDLLWQFQTQFAFYPKTDPGVLPFAFGALMALLCVFGTLYFALRNWRLFIICGGIATAYSVYIIFIVPDPDTLHKMDVHRTMYIPTWAMGSICWGFAWIGLRDFFEEFDLPTFGKVHLLQALAIILPFFCIAGNYYVNDRSKNWLGYDFARGILDCIEPNGILFVEGDDTITYNLLYQQKVEDYRTDVHIYDHFGIALYNPFGIDPNGRKILPGVPEDVTEERRKLTEKLAMIRQRLGRDPDTIFDLREDMFTHEIDALRMWKHDILIRESGRPCYYWQNRDLSSLGKDANGNPLYSYEWNSVVVKIVPSREVDRGKPWMTFPVRGVSAPANPDGSIPDYDDVDYPKFARDYRSSLLTTYYAERKAFYDFEMRNFSEAVKGFQFALQYMPNDGMYFNLAIAYDGYIEQIAAATPPSEPERLAKWKHDLQELLDNTIKAYRDYLKASPPTSERGIRAIERLGIYLAKEVNDDGVLVEVGVNLVDCDEILRAIEDELNKGALAFQNFADQYFLQTGQVRDHPTKDLLEELYLRWSAHKDRLLGIPPQQPGGN